MLDTRKLIQPFIDAEIDRLTIKARIESNIKHLQERLNPPRKSSGIERYEDRVAFTAGMFYPIFKDAYNVQSEFNTKIGDNTSQILEWISWLDEEKVNPHDVWVFIFKSMKDEEIAAWQSRFNELINDPDTGDMLVKWLKEIIDVSVVVGNKQTTD